MKRVRRAICFPLLLSCGLLWGCDRGQRSVPPDPGGLPPLAEAKTPATPAATGAATPAATGAAKGLPAGHPNLPADHPALPADHPALPADHPALPADHPALPADHPALPAGHGAMGADPGADKGGAGGRITGVIQLDDKVRGKVQPGTTLYLIARGVGPSGGAGPLLAVKRLTTGIFPMPFEMDGRDVMMQGASLQGQVILTARVDQDGDAMTKSPGDVEGATRPVQVGQGKIELVLDTVRSQAAGAPSPPNLGQGTP